MTLISILHDHLHNHAAKIRSECVSKCMERHGKLDPTAVELLVSMGALATDSAPWI